MSDERWARRNRQRRAKKRAEEAAERRHEELKEAWRQRHSGEGDETEGPKIVKLGDMRDLPRPVHVKLVMEDHGVSEDRANELVAISRGEVAGDEGEVEGAGDALG